MSHPMKRLPPALSSHLGDNSPSPWVGGGVSQTSEFVSQKPIGCTRAASQGSAGGESSQRVMHGLCQSSALRVSSCCSLPRLQGSPWL